MLYQLSIGHTYLNEVQEALQQAGVDPLPSLYPHAHGVEAQTRDRELANRVRAALLERGFQVRAWSGLDPEPGEAER